MSGPARHNEAARGGAPYRVVLYDDHEQSGGLGGGQLARLELYARLDRELFEPVLLCSQDGEMAERARQRGIEVQIRPINPDFEWFSRYELLNSPRKLWRLGRSLLGAARRLSAASEELEADLLHPNENLSRLITVVSRWCFGLQTPCVMHVDNEWDLGLTDFLLRNVFVAGFDRLIAVSEHVAELAERAWWPGGGKLRVVNEAVDAAAFLDDETAADPGWVREQLGIPEEAIVVATVGSLVGFKGQAEVIEALASLETYGAPPVHYLVIGEGPQRERLERLAEARGLSGGAGGARGARGARGQVHFLGFRDDVPRLLVGSDLLVQASATEAFPLAVVEGLLGGCRVVATDVGGTREILGGGRWGRLVSPGNGMRLKEKLEEALALELRALSREERPYVDSERQRWAAQRFGWERCVRETERIFLETVE